MNEQVNSAEYEFLWKLLANPADPNHSYIFNLQSLVSDFPQSGVLRALLMPNGDKRHIKHAAAYFNPRVLHKLNTAPESLQKVSADQIVFSDEPDVQVAESYFYTPPVFEPFVPPVTEETEASYTPVVDDSVEAPAAIVADEAAVIKTEDESPVTPLEPLSEQQAYELIFGVDPNAPAVEPERENIPSYIVDDVVPEQTAERYAEEIPAYIEDDLEPYNFGQDISTGTPIDEEPVHEEIAEAPIIEQVTVEHEPQPVIEEAVEEPVWGITEEPEARFSEEPISEVESLAKQYDTYLSESEAAPVHPVSSFDEGDRYFHQPIEDEVYDEIVSIEDIGLEQLAILNKAIKEDGETDNNYFVFEPEEPTAEAEPQAAIEAPQPVAEAPAIEEPATEPEVVIEAVQPNADQILAEQVNLHPAVINEEPIAQYHNTIADEKADVSMYNDEKMPYSFLWWLDKTRKEHADIYQPYASQAEPAPAAPPVVEVPQQKEPLDELQKQYYQNIVSTTSIAELDRNPPKAPSPAAGRKEDKIIERFIHEEPQIKHPADVKLDNENKAKRSSEDKEELVTETLARIYTEQMLYHKAILTYKKLMLKYPEKSLYFASQIEQLENKIN